MLEPAWSPDGQTLAFAALDGPLFLGPASCCGQEVTLDPASQPTWSPEGGRVLFVREGDLVAFDVASGTERLVFEGVAPNLGTWAANGEIVYSDGEAGADIWILDPFTGTRRQLTDHPLDETDPDWTPTTG